MVWDFGTTIGVHYTSTTIPKIQNTYRSIQDTNITPFLRRCSYHATTTILKGIPLLAYRRIPVLESKDRKSSLAIDSSDYPKTECDTGFQYFIEE